MNTTSLLRRLLTPRPARVGSRVRYLIPALVLAGLGLTGSGCTSTAPGKRFGGLAANPKAKTTLAVGDRPMPVVTGEPGASVAADEPEPTAPRTSKRPEGRISGRVYDADGRPVANARVRLAVGATPGGRDVRATTDRSGGFTLRDLRPGTDYTLVAEWDGPDGPQVGRIRTLANRTDVRIGLTAPDGVETTADAGSDLDSDADLPRIKVNRVSERDAVDEEEPGAVATPSALGGRGSARVNEEDLPPAPEAEAMAPARTPRPALARETTAADRWRRRGEADPETRAVSSRRPPVAPVDPPVADDGTEADPDAPVDAEPAAGAGGVDEDGPNPLPPALERPGGAASAARSGSGSGQGQGQGGADPFAAEVPAPRIAAAGDLSRSRPATNRSPSPAPSTGRDDAERRPAPSRRAAAVEAVADADEPIPGALVAVPETFAPVALTPAPEARPTRPPARTAAVTDPDTRRPGRSRPAPAPRRAPTPAVAPAEADPLGGLPPAIEPGGGRADAATLPPAAEPVIVAANEPARAVDANPMPAPAVEPAPTLAPVPSQEEVFETPQPLPSFVAASTPTPDASPTPIEAKPAEDPTPAKRPTWGDVAANAADLPPLEGGPAAPRGLAAVTSPALASATRDPGAATTAHVSTTPSAGPLKTAAGNVPACDYDDRHRRVLDFRLPGLDGRTLRLSDLDADLILLDFWGTWCQPCIKSVPHLVDLRARTAGKKLQIIGIACEAEPAEKSARKVKAKVDALRINYPIALSRNDGSCPVQEALHIQALPTLILLDREGRILWRGEGATPATLGRLDHMIAAATGDKTGGTVRR